MEGLPVDTDLRRNVSAKRGEPSRRIGYIEWTEIGGKRVSGIAGPGSQRAAFVNKGCGDPLPPAARPHAGPPRAGFSRPSVTCDAAASASCPLAISIPPVGDARRFGPLGLRRMRST